MLPAWRSDDPSWGFVQSMYAFGLEENGDYRGAEAAARAALTRNAKDVWGVHALAHVFEMEGAHEAGVSFLTTSSPHWQDSYFAVHNWWHLGLYLLEAGRVNDALALYDERVRARHSTEWLDVVDAAALLWRLSLYGQDVSFRAQALAADIDDLVGVPAYIFNDWHAVMAFGLAGDQAGPADVVAANRHLTASTNKQAAERAGLSLLTAFSAFSSGDPAAAVESLIGIRPQASVVGGSHAQRDVIDLTLIAAAVRSGQTALVRALVTERVARKPAAGAAARALVAANGGDEYLAGVVGPRLGSEWTIARMDAAQAGPTNSLADVHGLRVGHATLAGDGWLTGVTVVLAPPEGATGGVDVRGGGPGTRETDLLSPLNQVEKVNAIVLSGGSAYGLAAAHGVMTRLAALHRGVQVGAAVPRRAHRLGGGPVRPRPGRGLRQLPRPRRRGGGM